MYRRLTTHDFADDGEKRVHSKVKLPSGSVAGILVAGVSGIVLDAVSGVFDVLEEVEELEDLRVVAFATCARDVSADAAQVVVLSFTHHCLSLEVTSRQ